MSRRHNPLERLRHPRSSNEHLVARLIVLSIATVAIDLLVSFAFYLLERGAAGTEITNYGDALFWTSSQITTISSSLRNPITTGGRILAAVTDFLAIAIVSVLFGTIVDRMRTRTQP
jgi:Ion channel